MIAGLVATLVVSGMVLLKSAMGLWPDLNLISLLVSLGSITPVQAWMDHFIIGVVVWGLVYAAVDGMYPTGPHWLKGLAVGLGAWVVMMVAFMPLAKAGLFGFQIGLEAPLVTLAYHVVYGLALGLSYGALTVLAPAKESAE
jgi:hypothetical protein